MKTFRPLALCVLVLAGLPLARPATAQEPKQPKPAALVIKAQGHAHFADYQARANRDPGLRTVARRKGQDVAFTEWMQRDHPYVFASSCVKDAGRMAQTFKSTEHMADFDGLLGKRADLRLSAEKSGHDAAFADWLRTERPDTYRQHFHIKATPPPAQKGTKPGAERRK